MSLDASTILAAIELAVIVIGGSIAWFSYKKSVSANAVDFVVGVEGQLDPLRNSALAMSPGAIRECYPNQIPDDFSEEEVVAYAYLYLTYSHISRMYFIFDETGLHSPLLSAKDRDYNKQLWMNYIASFKESRVMQRVHDNAKLIREHNRAFLDAADQVLGS
ncbi:MAG: hypothetical protein AAF468_20665 [Pseudomonadota bacterium]